MLSALLRFFMLIHCSNKLVTSSVVVVHNIKGKCRDTSVQIQQAILLGVL